MSSDCQVSVSGGVLQGKTSESYNGKDYFSFLGIPYAEPPIQELRFREPITKKPWTGVLDATTEGSCAPQLDMFTMTFTGHEDCLYLNIHTPSLPGDNTDCDSLPVIVYIHGGAFLFMSGSTDWFSPDFLIENNVILVTINFRLGAFGFLCLDIPEVPGNAGLKDQLMALKWIKENISKFNGDSENITLFGISSGASCVEYHMLSPLSQKLFQKAIMQSGSSLNPWAKIREPEKMVEKLANLLGIEEKDPYELFKLLKEIDQEKLTYAMFKVSGDDEYKECNMFSFTPVIEKKFPEIESFLDKEPLDIIKQGNFSQMPTISGFCSKEGLFFKTKFSESLMQQLKDNLYTNFLPMNYKINKTITNEKLQKLYNTENFDEDSNNFLSDVHFISGIYKSVKLRSARSSDKNYLYEFTHGGNINFLKSIFKMPIDGALHGDDSTYLSLSKFVDNDAASEDDKMVRERMVKMWTDFAKTGNPTPEETSLITTKWLPVSEAEEEETMLLNISKDMMMVPFPYSERMEVWNNVYAD